MERRDAKPGGLQLHECRRMGLSHGYGNGHEADEAQKQALLILLTEERDGFRKE